MLVSSKVLSCYLFLSWVVCKILFEGKVLQNKKLRGKRLKTIECPALISLFKRIGN